MNKNKAGKSLWENPGPDEGWAWMVVLGLFITGYTALGLYGSLGIVYPVFMYTMKLSPDEASWPFFISYVTSTLTGIVVPLLSRLYSIRQILLFSKLILIVGCAVCFFSPKSLMVLLLFFGIPTGIFAGTFIQSTLLILGTYFQDLKARAQSLSLTGGALAMITFMVLVQYLTEIFEYRAVVLLIGAVVAQTLPSTLLLRPRNEKQFKCLRTRVNEGLLNSQQSPVTSRVDYIAEKDETESSVKNGTETKVNISKVGSQSLLEKNLGTKIIGVFQDLIDILRRRETYFFVIPDASMMLAFYLTFVITIDHGYRSGVSNNIITIHMIVFGCVALFSRICVAAFADRKCIDPFHLIKASVLLKITTCLIFSFRTTPVTFLLNSVLIPWTISGYNGMRLTYVTKFFEIKDIAIILTLSNILLSIGGILSPSLLGLSMAITRDYRAIWAFVAALLIIGFLLMILEPFVIRKKPVVAV